MKQVKIKLLNVACALSFGVIATLITGCSGSSWGDDEQTAKNDGYSYSKGVDGSPTFVGSNGTGEDAKLANQYYFKYDDSNLNEEQKTEIRKHARYLGEHPKVTVRVEGHTDERGSREYNIALGERRAKSVSSLLTSEGANQQQVAVVSYGTEKPAVQGHDENAYKWNRRAKLVYEENAG